MKLKIFLALILLLAALSLPAGATLSASSSTSTSEVTTGNSFTVTVTVSNTATTGSETGVTVGIDLTQTNGGLSLDATSIKLQNTTDSITITAGNQLTQTWTVYTRAAGIYTNQIKITIKQNNQEVSGVSPLYESVTVKDPAAFAAPSLNLNTTIPVNSEFNLNITTQNTGDYSIKNATVTITDSENSIELLSSQNTTAQTLQPNALFSTSFHLKFTQASTHTLTITYSSDNAATTTKTTTITVTSNTGSTTSSSTTRGGGGGGGGSLPSTIQSRILQKGTAKFTGTVGEYISQITIPGATGSIKVKILDKNPTKKTPKVKALKYLEITLSGKDKTGKITFKVTDKELKKHGLARDKISLYRYTDKWNQLPTTLKTTTQGGENIYEAETPGFSYFMIAEKTTTPKPTTQPKVTPEPSTPKPQTTTETPSGGESSKLLPALTPAIAILTLLTAAYTYHRKNKQK